MPKDPKSAQRNPVTPLPKVDPRFVSPVLATVVQRWTLSEADPSREAAVALLSRLVGTAGDGMDPERARRLLDWFVREYVPVWLDSAGMIGEARSLRRLPAVINATAADRANEALVKVLAAAQTDAERAQEQLRTSISGVHEESAPKIAEAWNAAVDLIEEVVRGEEVRSLEAGTTAGARAGAAELAKRAGWNLGVSAAEMLAQSIAWRKAEPQVASCVAAAAKGEEWTGRAAEAKEAAAEALTPAVHELSRLAVHLIEQLIHPRYT